MPREIAVVTDSTACLSPEELTEFGIPSVPLQFIFDDKVYFDGDLSEGRFFELLVAAKNASTSAPTVDSFIEAYHKLAAAGVSTMLSVHLSTKVSSGTFESSQNAVEMVKRSYPDIEIVFWDSQYVSAGLGWQVSLAARMAKSGASVGQILEALEDQRSRIRLLAMLPTLEFLKRGGRIGKAQAWFGTLLNLKPILTLTEGEVHPVARERTIPKAFDRMVTIASSWGPLERVAVSSGVAEDHAASLASLMSEKGVFTGEVEQIPISLVIGVHGGPGIVGIFAEQESKA